MTAIKSEADKRRDVIRAAVEYELVQGPAFTPANWDEAKGKTLEDLLHAYTDSLVDCFFDEPPSGQELTDLIEAVTIGSEILGVDYLAEIRRQS